MNNSKHRYTSKIKLFTIFAVIALNVVLFFGLPIKTCKIPIPNWMRTPYVIGEGGEGEGEGFEPGPTPITCNRDRLNFIDNRLDEIINQEIPQLEADKQRLIELSDEIEQTYSDWLAEPIPENRGESKEKFDAAIQEANEIMDRLEPILPTPTPTEEDQGGR